MTESTDWQREGYELGVTLDRIHALVVVGRDPTATAEVALGIGRAQAGRRRVAVGDLLGDAPPLRSLVADEEPEGLVDAFVYGASMNRIAYPVPDAGELFVMPSGTSPIDHDELLPNPRWRRLAAGFKEVGALLVLAAPSGAAHLKELVDATDGAVLVGDEVPRELSVAQSLAWLRPIRHAPISVAPTAAAAASRADAVALPVRELRAGRGLWAAAAGIVLTLSIIGGGYWFAGRPFAAKGTVRTGVAAGSSAGVALTGGALATDSAVRADEARRDSISRDSAARAAMAAVATDSFPVLPVANSPDSTSASAFAVVLENTNGLAGAILDLRGRYASVPAGSYAIDQRTRYYQLTAGAYPTRAGAESLLVQLRARRVLAAGFGSVTSTPLAFLVEARVPLGEVAPRLARAAARAQPVYALRQPDGTANLYFGSYESPQQAALAVPAVRKAGLTPTLVYRMGRVF